MPPKRKQTLTTYGKQHSHSTKRRLSLVDLTHASDHDMSWTPSQWNPEPLLAKQPPPSQKAATMIVEPSPENIAEVVEFVGCSPAEAVRWLKVKQNNVQQAINAAFEGVDLTKLEEGTTWDESVWQTDRDGNAQNLVPLGASAAPSRRPSPVSSLQLTNPKTKADEDSDLALALAASQADISQPFQQESGLVKQDGTDVTFGPATKEHYDATRWALVPTFSAATEIVPDVLAKERVHTGKAPRLLKHLPDGDYTPNLLTICHAIPKAREAFLMRQHTKSDYGHASDWWKGHSIPTPRIVHIADGSVTEPDTSKYDELIAEIQRLMAFLDGSDRVYATIGGITDADVIKNNDLRSTESGSLVELFLQSWTMAARSVIGSHQPPDLQELEEQVNGLFFTAVGTNASEGMAVPAMSVVDMSLKSGDDGKKDLLELLDNLLWDTNPHDVNPADNYIERPADILVMKVSRPTTPLDVEVPASFYLDKYMQENVAATKATRQQMLQGKKRIEKIEAIENKVKVLEHPLKKDTQIDALQLLRHTHGHFSGKNRKDADQADTTNSASLANGEPVHYSGIAAQLEQVVASIEKKLAILAEEKEKTRKAVSDMSRQPPPGLQESELQYRYSLRGVATKSNITYVLAPKAANDNDEIMEQSEDDTTPEGYQWWRLEYEVTGSNARLHRTKAGDYDVLRAVELEHNSALLVYASDDATDEAYRTEEDLPPALQHFVIRDNRDFAVELANEQLDPPAYGDDLLRDMSDVPRQSIERRASMDSLNVTGPDTPPDESPPSYGGDDQDASRHSTFGLGYGTKADPPVAEIHLEPEVNVLGDEGSGGRDVEMVEKQRGTLIPRSEVGARPVLHDTAMSGAESQDIGVGGTTHVEDTDMR